MPTGAEALSCQGLSEETGYGLVWEGVEGTEHLNL